MHHGGTDQHAHRGEIVRGPRHEVSGALLLVIADRQPLQMGIEIVAHFVLDAPRVGDDEPALQEEEETFQRSRADEQESVPDQRGAGDCFGQLVDGVPHDERLGQRKRGRRRDAEKSERERELVAAEIRQQTTSRSHVSRI